MGEKKESSLTRAAEKEAKREQYEVGDIRHFEIRKGNSEK